MSELVFNIWFIVDISTGISQYYFLKIYGLEGEDEEKFQLLRRLADFDYVTCERQEVPKNHQLVMLNTGKRLNGIPLHELSRALEINLNSFLKEAESKLPPILHFDPYRGNHHTTNQTLGEQPLYVMTVLFENEVGEMKPYTKDEYREWAESEMYRLGYNPNLFR